MLAKPQTYYIKTLGCAANTADSEHMAGILESLGMEPVIELKGNNEDETLIGTLPHADIFIVNTCSVRQKSEDKVYGLGRILKIVKEQTGKTPFVIMAGCMVGSVTGERQRYIFDELRKRTSWANAYIGSHQLNTIPKLLLEHNLLDEWAVKKFDPSNVEAKRTDNTHAFVNISYGCDNFCTFCVVPYARGKEISRSKEEILKEVRHLAERGFKEVTLCGQNVNSWGLGTSEKFEIRTGSDQKLPFADLLRSVHEIEGIEKISFISSNPFDFTNDLIETLKLPRISNYLHIAVQSGNNEVLKRMNRRHTIEDFLNLAAKIKEAKPDAEFGTDLIVGFPGETEEQFEDTISLVKKVRFNVAFIAMYSPRKGTPSERFYKDDVSRDEKKRRHAKLTKVWRESLR